MTRRSDTRFRQRKLSNKQSLAVLRESQYDAVEDDAQRNIPQIETGVERGEEIEHHLQAAINSAAPGVSEKKVVIPTPATSQLPDEDYAKRYPKRFKLPVSYIRFSSTVEDCNGTAYCMSEVDDKFLAELNSSRSGLPPIKEDEFETIIDAYEAAIQVKQPFLATEPSSISSYEDLEEYLDDALNPELKPIAKLVYGHWKAQKLMRGGRSIIPSLKFEQGNEKDDGDPYVCFRRREVRNTRKTRRTDTTSTDKLKRLRQELEIARGLVKDVWQREMMRKATFELERNIFEKRRAVVDLKRKYQIKDTDEDLINKPKRSRPEQTAPTTRIPVRHDGKPPEADLKQLVHILAEEEKRIRERALQLQRARHRPDVVDLTNDAVSALPHYNPQEKFVGVQTFFAPLPTPPSSNDSAPNSPEPTQRNAPISPQQPGRIPVVLAPPWQNVPNFRRRLGRGGRMFIDRRSSRAAPRPDGVDDLTLDRYKYDNYDDSDSEPPSYQMNLHSEDQIKFRARLLSPPPDEQRALAQRRAMNLAQQNPAAMMAIAANAGNPAAINAAAQAMLNPNGNPQLMQQYQLQQQKLLRQQQFLAQQQQQQQQQQQSLSQQGSPILRQPGLAGSPVLQQAVMAGRQQSPFQPQTQPQSQLSPPPPPPPPSQLAQPPQPPQPPFPPQIAVNGALQH